MATHKKTLLGGAVLVFLDESGFLLFATLRRTLAPRGHTPIHRH
jgi:hypothetical protein